MAAYDRQWGHSGAGHRCVRRRRVAADPQVLNDCFKVHISEPGDRPSRSRPPTCCSPPPWPVRGRWTSRTGSATWTPVGGPISWSSTRNAKRCCPSCWRGSIPGRRPPAVHPADEHARGRHTTVSTYELAGSRRRRKRPAQDIADDPADDVACRPLFAARHATTR